MLQYYIRWSSHHAKNTDIFRCLHLGQCDKNTKWWPRIAIIFQPYGFLHGDIPTDNEGLMLMWLSFTLTLFISEHLWTYPYKLTKNFIYSLTFGMRLIISIENMVQKGCENTQTHTVVVSHQCIHSKYCSM